MSAIINMEGTSKMRHKRLIILMVTLGLAFSQTIQAQPSQAEAQDLRDEAMLKLDTFMKYVIMIGNRGEDDYDDETKQMAIERALQLFKPDARMEVTSYTRENSSFYEMEHYLYRLKDSLRYDRIDISFLAEAIYFSPDDLRPVPGLQDTYSGIITVVQVFEGSYDQNGEHKVAYRDQVKKLVEVIARKEEYPQGVKWQVILGDVSASETRKI